VLESCRWIGLLLLPLLPDLASRILQQLDCPSIPCDAFWPAQVDGETARASATRANAAWRQGRQWGVLPANTPLPEPSPVMQRLELLEPL